VATKTSVKRAKFLELAQKRMTNALHDIRLVGNLSNRAAYEYSEKDVQKMIKALEDALSDLKKRYRNPASTGRIEFKIED
jgi:transcription elongation GreA/GreB family factor